MPNVFVEWFERLTNRLLKPAFEAYSEDGTRTIDKDKLWDAVEFRRRTCTVFSAARERGEKLLPVHHPIVTPRGVESTTHPLHLDPPVYTVTWDDRATDNPGVIERLQRESAARDAAINMRRTGSLLGSKGHSPTKQAAAAAGSSIAAIETAISQATDRESAAALRKALELLKKQAHPKKSGNSNSPAVISPPSSTDRDSATRDSADPKVTSRAPSRSNSGASLSLVSVAGNKPDGDGYAEAAVDSFRKQKNAEKNAAQSKKRTCDKVSKEQQPASKKSKVSY